MGTRMAYTKGSVNPVKNPKFLLSLQTGLTWLNNLKYINVLVMAILCFRSVVFLQQPEPF